MLLLTGTNQSLELVTATVQTTDFVVSFMDITTTTLAPGSNDGTIASAATTTIVASPGASTQRQIKHLAVRNTGTLANTVTVQKDVGGTNRTIFAVSLAAGEELEYLDGTGFHVFDTAGAIKMTGGGGGGGTVPTGTGFRHVTVGAEDTAAKLVDTADINDDQVTFAKLQNVTSDRLLGRDTAATGDLEQLTVGGGIEFTGAGGIQRSALTGDVTASAGSGATTIANNAVTTAKIADDAVTMDKLATAEIDDGSSGTADTIDFSAGPNHRSTLTGNVTYTFTAPANHGRVQIRLIQDATGGRTVTWPASVRWPGGTAPAVNTGANTIHIVTFFYDGTNFYSVASLSFA
jgi:hypothetical protein